MNAGAVWNDNDKHDPKPRFAPDPDAGAAASSSFGTYVIAIAEGRRNEVGVAAMDIATPDIFVSQFCDSTQSYRQTVSFIFRYQPIGAILLSNSCSKRCEQAAAARATSMHRGLCIATFFSLSRCSPAMPR